MPSVRWCGRSVSIPRSPALTSTQLGREKRGTLPGTIGQADPQTGQAGQALGRSRGGWTTKLHLVVDGRGLPMTVLITAGNINDSVVFEHLMAQVRVPRPGGGHPRTTPDVLLGDKGYSARRIRAYLRRRRITAVIPEPRDQQANRARKGSRGGRPPAFDAELYKNRNVIERCFARLKHFRAIATRFDKLASRYRSGVLLASLILWLRELSDRP
jgi:transposase